MMKIITLCFVVLMSFTFWPSFAESGKVGVVDGEKLFDEYPGAQDASKKIANAQDELRQAITDSEKTYTEFEKQKKSEAEKLTKQKELQAKIDAKAQETRKFIESVSNKIETDIVSSIKTVAGEKGIDVVFDKRAVLYGGTDLTEVVSSQLKKKVPLAKAGENENSPAQKELDIKKTN